MIHMCHILWNVNLKKNWNFILNMTTILLISMYLIKLININKYKNIRHFKSNIRGHISKINKKRTWCYDKKVKEKKKGKEKEKAFVY